MSQTLQVHGPQPTSLQVLLLQPTAGSSLSLGFSRQGHWSGLPFLFSGDLPDPGIEPWSPVLQANSLPSELQGIFRLVFNLLSSFYAASVFCFQTAVHFSSAFKGTFIYIYIWIYMLYIITLLCIVLYSLYYTWAIYIIHMHISISHINTLKYLEQIF